jgi:carbon-monoxide dehydrogenase small subunit
MLAVTMTVNGERQTARAWPMERLLDVLRREMGLTGTKEGCGEGECGACAVLLDGELVNSCLVPAAQADGCAVTTIEGIGNERLLSEFAACGGTQCGFCTPGMVVAAEALLRERPQPTEEEIREGLAGNLCRCTGYTGIVAAVRRAGR